MPRRAARLEALAVLRGEAMWNREQEAAMCEVDKYLSDNYKAAADALERAIAVLEGKAEPRPHKDCNCAACHHGRRQ